MDVFAAVTQTLALQRARTYRYRYYPQEAADADGIAWRPMVLVDTREGTVSFTDEAGLCGDVVRGHWSEGSGEGERLQAMGFHL